MTHDDADQLINEYLDDELTPEDRRRIENRLQHDEDFRARLRQQQALLSAAAALPRTIAAPADAWNRIADQIEAQKVLDADFGSRAPSPWPKRIALAAAAIVIMVVSSSATVFLLRPSSTDASAALSAEAVIVQAAADVQAAYAVTIDELRDVLDARRDVLSPETVGAIEESLAAIDQAIRAASDALTSDPASDFVLRQLEGAYRNKVEVLARAAQLAAES